MPRAAACERGGETGDPAAQHEHVVHGQEPTARSAAAPSLGEPDPAVGDDLGHRVMTSPTLSIRRVAPRWAANATSTSPSSRSSGRSSFASRTSTYSSVDRAVRSPRCRGRPLDDVRPDRARPPATASAAAAQRAGQHRRGARVRRASRYALRLDTREPVGFAHERSNRRPRPAGSGRRSCGARRRAAARPCGRSRRGTVRRSRRASATTVVTPSKCVGRAAPHRSAVSPATCTVVSGGHRVHLGDARA